MQADIDARLAADLAHCRAYGLPESIAYETADWRRHEHAKYESAIARYRAAGYTRAHARRMLRLAARGIWHRGQLA